MAPQTEEAMEKQMIRIVEVSLGATAKEIEDVLNAPYAEGFYYASQLPCNDASMLRVWYKRRVREA